MANRVSPYVIKMVHRMILLAFSALMGIVAGMFLVVPILMLHALGVIGYRVEEHDGVVWIFGIIGAFWGIAHMLDTLIKTEKGER